jgi:hypothetical protein
VEYHYRLVINTATSDMEEGLAAPSMNAATTATTDPTTSESSAITASE